MQLKLTAAAAVDAEIHRKMFVSGASCNFDLGTLIILNKEIKDIMKILNSLEDLGILRNEMK